MKTKNNVQKAVLRSAAVVVSLVLISYTVSAQEFWKRLLTNSSFGDIALAMSAENESHADALGEISNYMDFAVEVEPELVLEDWMTDGSKFNASTLTIETVVDTELDLEPWMTDEGTFEPTEKAPELESWMISEAGWHI
ncbi:MAG: hypothetical protein ACK5M7_13040 [Draconibacterium sp.]